jgi:hypothetical protein
MFLDFEIILSLMLGICRNFLDLLSLCNNIRCIVKVAPVLTSLSSTP